MKRVCKLLGGFCLGIAALVAITGPASLSGIGIEEIPVSIKNKR